MRSSTNSSRQKCNITVTCIFMSGGGRKKPLVAEKKRKQRSIKLSQDETGCLAGHQQRQSFHAQQKEEKGGRKKQLQYLPLEGKWRTETSLYVQSRNHSISFDLLIIRSREKPLRVFAWLRGTDGRSLRTDSDVTALNPRFQDHQSLKREGGGREVGKV